jgi:lysophospholipase L1-like esterase
VVLAAVGIPGILAAAAVPVVTITTPADGSQLSGTITIRANVTADAAVIAGAFNVDNANLVFMTPAGGAAWEGTLDTTTVNDGPHILGVGGLDANGEIGVALIGVFIVNAAGPAWPDSMAAIGDSITRGVFADNSPNGFANGQPEHSWAAGWDGGDVVVSHYERILGQNGAILGNLHNNAVSGARMDDFLAQANATIPQHPDYVLVLLGPNDLCRDSVSQIPSNAQFETWFRQGIDALRAGLPNAKIVVLEIIDVAQLWDCCSRNGGCLFAWLLYSPCKSVTGSNSTDRATVRQRTIGFNNILRNVCAEKGVTFEDDVFEQIFTLNDVSDFDCFHPSVYGQRKIAEGTWDAGRF